MRKRSVFTILGVILMIAGVAALVYGLTTYNALQNDIANRFTKAIAGSSEKENQALYVSIVGGVGVLAGLVLVFANMKKATRKKRRR
ncbi:MAG: DUF3185 family protein [Spirochaetales bacterium]|nr:DUF3185 family protein [Spirochaetales bacterium]